MSLFCLPRIDVNLAALDAAAARECLLLMARKLLRWMQARLVLVLVLLLIGYHAWCAVLYLRSARGAGTRSHVGYRWSNETPALLLTAIVVLVVVKPF